jgi:hypothetical protein
VTEPPFDLLSEPDATSRELRDQLQQWALASALALPHERALVLVRELRDVARDALDLLTGLLLLRRCLIVLMEADGVQALALPFPELTRASLVPLRVTHDPRVLPNVLQLRLPGSDVAVDAEATPTPGAGWDSEGQREAERYRAALATLRQQLLNDAGRDTLLALIDATLRS